MRHNLIFFVPPSECLPQYHFPLFSIIFCSLVLRFVFYEPLTYTKVSLLEKKKRKSWKKDNLAILGVKRSHEKPLVIDSNEISILMKKFAIIIPCHLGGGSLDGSIHFFLVLLVRFLRTLPSKVLPNAWTRLGKCEPILEWRISSLAKVNRKSSSVWFINSTTSPNWIEENPWVRPHLLIFLMKKSMIFPINADTPHDYHESKWKNGFTPKAINVDVDNWNEFCVHIT